MATAVLGLLEVYLAEADRAAHHADRDADRFVEPRAAFIELGVVWGLLVGFLETE
jgi:hypothetical protein